MATKSLYELLEGRKPTPVSPAVRAREDRYDATLRAVLPLLRAQTFVKTAAIMRQFACRSVIRLTAVDGSVFVVGCADLHWGADHYYNRNDFDSATPDWHANCETRLTDRAVAKEIVAKLVPKMLRVLRDPRKCDACHCVARTVEVGGDVRMCRDCLGGPAPRR